VESWVTDVRAQEESLDNVCAFQIRWASSDLSLFETPPLPGLTAPTTDSQSDKSTLSSTAQPSLPTAEPSNQDSGRGSGLSRGAVAGIAVGTTSIFFIGLLAIVAYIRRRRRREWPQNFQGYVVSTNTKEQPVAIPSAYAEYPRVVGA